MRTETKAVPPCYFILRAPGTSPAPPHRARTAAALGCAPRGALGSPELRGRACHSKKDFQAEERPALCGARAAGRPGRGPDWVAVARHCLHYGKDRRRWWARTEGHRSSRGSPLPAEGPAEPAGRDAVLGAQGRLPAWCCPSPPWSCMASRSWAPGDRSCIWRSPWRETVPGLGTGPASLRPPAFSLRLSGDSSSSSSSSDSPNSGLRRAGSPPPPPPPPATVRGAAPAPALRLPGLH